MPMHPDEFDDVVERALALVPTRFQSALDDIAVCIEDRAPREMGRLYGLYQGVPRTRPESFGYGQLPPRITIYREPLEHDFPDRQRLIGQICITVLHEIGHHLGMNEQQLKDLGYG
jgi:predicted Zn-dependent protease with MMP-like domain